jgi:hypothetical protein
MKRIAGILLLWALIITPCMIHAATSITTRAGVGRSLTWSEMDTNFSNLRNATDGYAANLGASLASLLQSQTAGTVGFQSVAAMNADLAHTAGAIALVTNDPTSTNNTYYIKLGGSGSGSWQKSALTSAVPLVNASLYADFATAVAAQGSTPAILVVSSAMSTSVNITVPATCAVWVLPSGSLNPAISTVLTINLLVADKYQIFGGLGRISLPSNDVAYPEWFPGSSIDAAVDALVAGTVRLSARTYIQSTISTRSGSAGSYIVPKSGVNIIGSGDASVIQAAAGQSPSIPWSFIYSSTGLLSNCEFRNFKLDGGTNLLDSGTTAQTNRFIGSDGGGLDIVIDNITLTNGPGNNPIAFGNAVGAGRITIINCRFTEMGSGKIGNYNTDHTDIYLHGDNNKIINCYFRSTNRVAGAAWEFHGNLGEARGNYVERYTTAFWVAPDSATFTETNIHNNRFINVDAVGLNGGTGTSNYGRINIHDNIFTMDSGAQGRGAICFIYGPDTTTRPGSELNIYNNRMYGLSGTTINGIQIGYNKTARIYDNYMENFNIGISFSHGDGFSDTYSAHEIFILNNQMKNMTNAPIYSVAATKIKKLVISGNSLVSDTAKAFPAIYAQATVDGGFIGGNVIDAQYVYPLGMGAGSASLQIDQMGGSGDIRFVRYSAANAAYGVGSIRYTSGYAAPSTGYGAPGDISYPTTPTVGQPKGHICTSFGVPGGWVSMGNL